MKPFSIQCESCAAKLTVAKQRLIGKRLPCPRCQTIILVQAPLGQNQSAEETQPVERTEPTERTEPAADPAADTAEGDRDLAAASFADVDDLLASIDTAPEATRPAQSSAPRRPQPARTAKPAAGKTTPDSVEGVRQPWANPAATAMRRRLAWVAGIAGGALLLIAAATAWTLRPPSPSVAVTDQIAKPTADAPPTVEESTNATASKAGVAKDRAGDDAENIGVPPTFDTNSVDLPDGINRPTDDADITNATPPPIDIASPVVVPSKPLATASATDAATETATPANGTSAGPTTETPKSSAALTLKPVAAAESSLAELAALLEQSGSSISQITDATTNIGSEESIGLPKYFFRNEVAPRIDVARQLQLPCDGIRYPNASLLQVLREITRISGVPITLDLSAFPAAENTQLIPVADFDISDTNFAGAIEQCVSPHGLAAIAIESSVIISIADATTAVKRSHDLQGISSLGDQRLEQLTEMIKAMIGGDSWFADTQRFQIDRQGRQLSITHLPSVHAQVTAFLKKASAALSRSTNNPTPAVDEATLQTRLGKAAAVRGLPCELPITTRSTLGDLLDRIHAHTGVQVVANWQTLTPQGWTPRTSVPGNVTEPTLGELLDQLERSLKARAIVVDSATVELTTRDDALQRPTVEFYFITDQFQERFAPERILQLVQEAIAGSPGGRRSLIVYQPQLQSIIVSAPQMTHRTIESVIAQLRGLDTPQTP